MTNQKVAQSDGLQAVLQALCLSEEEERAAREFFAGQAGEEVLAKFEFRDLAEAASDPSKKLFKELTKKRKHSEIRRLFLLLFAKGQTTCLWMLPEDLYGLMEELGDVDGAKRAAMYAVGIGVGVRNANVYSLVNLLEFADYDSQTLKKALEYEKNTFLNAKLVLLALYFSIKYGRMAEMRDQKASDVLASSAMQHGKQESDLQEHGGGVTIEKEDLPLLSLYEEYTVACLAALHFRNPANPGYRSAKVYAQEDPKVFQKLMAAVSGDGFEEVEQSLKGVGIGNSWTLLRLTAGLSYLNYRLSDRLRNVIRLCVAARVEETLGVLRGVSIGTPFDIARAGEAYDRIFSIDGERYIRWALEKELQEILKQQIADNTETYLFVMGKMGVKEANRMLALIKEQAPELHEKLLAQRSPNGENEDKEKVIAEIVKGSVNSELAGAYLRGECGADALYPRNWMDGKKHYYAGGYARDFVDGYLSNYGEPEFFRRCEVYMLVSHGGYFFRRDVTPGTSCRERANPQGVLRIFADFEAEGVPLIWQVSAVSLIYDTLLYEDGQRSFLEEAAKVFGNYLADGKRREELGVAFAAADAVGRCFAVRAYALDVKRNKEEILAYSQDSAKAVRQELLDVLCARREFEGKIKEMLLAKRAAERELAVKVLLCWQGKGADYRELFRQALAKEKNVKIKELLRDVLEENGQEAGGVQEASREELVKEIHSGGRKRSLAWAYETPFSVVHTVDKGVVDERYLQAVLLCYAAGKEVYTTGSGTGGSMGLASGSGTGGSGSVVPASGNGTGGNTTSATGNGGSGNAVPSSGYGLSRSAAFLAEILDADEFAVYVNELFDKWLEAGAEAKKRWVLYAAAIHGGAAIIEKFKQQIKEWPQHGRSAIACEAVKALSLSPLPQGLLTVDAMARKFKSRQVRAAAGEALNFAAAQLNLTRGELADRIVPDFGFDGNMERRFDYGTRSFLVAITPELELEVFDGKEQPEEGEFSSSRKFTRGEKRKTLPAPGKKDDEKMAAVAYEEFKQMKKQLKTVVTNQKQRMEQALATAREWRVEAWKQLFVKNPIMRPFATGLIWGVYENGKLGQSFRYMEDGSFNTADEEEYTLPEGRKTLGQAPQSPTTDHVLPQGGETLGCGRIRLVHPLELSEETKAAWKGQLADYEIIQPIKQLDREIYAVDEEEAGLQELIRFHGHDVNGAALNSKLMGFGWEQAPVENAGRFFAYYREDAEAGLAARLDFSGNYTSGRNEEVTLYGVRFYRTGTDGQGIRMRGAVDESKACLLKDVPARYFSEVVWQITKAATP